MENKSEGGAPPRPPRVSPTGDFDGCGSMLYVVGTTQYVLCMESDFMLVNAPEWMDLKIARRVLAALKEAIRDAEREEAEGRERSEPPEPTPAPTSSSDSKGGDSPAPRSPTPREGE